MVTFKSRALGFVAMASLLPLATGCGGSDSSSAVGTVTPTPASTATATPAPTSQAALIPANFVPAGLASAIATQSCTLSGGTVTTCYRITTAGTPSGHEVGPFCPRDISDAGKGMWIDNGQTYDLTGDFIKNLAVFYNDANWKLYDDATGNIRVTDTQTAFEAAAQPNVPAAYFNYCVEGKMSYVNGGVSRTYLIPLTPVPLKSGTGSIDQNGVGLALDGITFDPPAPVDRIKAAYTIAAFDDCGGHINPHEGYHYHAATNCSTSVVSSDGHSALIGYALDGYGMYARTDTAGMEPADLDSCRGHTDTVRGYHYHVASAGENMFIGCFHGERGSAI